MTTLTAAADAERFYAVRRFASGKVTGSRLMTQAEAEREVAAWLAGIGPAAVVPATKDLAHAVRTEDQAVLAPLLPPAVPTADVTEHAGYTVRVVLQGKQEDWQLPNWSVAAEHPTRGWITWTVVNDHGPLLYTGGHTHSVPAPAEEGTKAAALADMAERAGIKPGTIRFEAFDRETGQRWAVSDWDRADRPKLTAYVTRTTKAGRSRVTLTFDNGTQKHYPKS